MLGIKSVYEQACDSAYSKRPKKRFKIGLHWCSTNPYTFGGIEWQQIIDSETGEKWFWNRRDKTYRPWRETDKEIRSDKYVPSFDEILIPMPKIPMPTLDELEAEYQKVTGKQYERTNNKRDRHRLFFCIDYGCLVANRQNGVFG